MEIKRQIIESKFPPQNKEVWWFDVNTNTLKRYTRGKWYIFDAIPFDIPMPDDHTIVYLCGYDMEYTAEEIKNSFDKDLFGGIASCTISYVTISFNEHDYSDYYLCRVTFNNPVTLIEDIYTVPMPWSDYVDTIKYPGNLASIPTMGIKIEGHITPDVVLGENVRYIADQAIYSEADIRNLILLAQNPPVLGGHELVITENGPVNVIVYVPDEAVSLYERATNWSYFTIKPLSKYGSLPVLKQF